jgi:hypothetical protein
LLRWTGLLSGGLPGFRFYSDLLFSAERILGNVSAVYERMKPGSAGIPGQYYLTCTLMALLIVDWSVSVSVSARIRPSACIDSNILLIALDSIECQYA